MLSNTTKYALRALIYIAVTSKDGEKVGLKTISEELDIPTPFLAKILQQMARQKILISTKGPGGGFTLRNHPSEVKLIDVVKLFDNEEIFETCFISNQNCSTAEKPCLIHDQVTEIREKIIEVFTHTTVQALIDKTKAEGVSNFFI